MRAAKQAFRFTALPALIGTTFPFCLQMGFHRLMGFYSINHLLNGCVLEFKYSKTRDRSSFWRILVLGDTSQNE